MFKRIKQWIYGVSDKVSYKTQRKILRSDPIYKATDYANQVIDWLMANGKPAYASDYAVYINANNKEYKVWLSNFPDADLDQVIDTQAQDESGLYDKYSTKEAAYMMHNRAYTGHYGIVYCGMVPSKEKRIQFYGWLNDHDIPMRACKGAPRRYLKKF